METKKLMKKAITLFYAITFLFFLTSCSSENKMSSEAAKYPHEDFTYDSKLKWNSSYSDVIKLYGQPDSIFHQDSRYNLQYYKPQVIGQTFRERSFWIDRTTGRVQSIHIESEPFESNPLKSESGARLVKELKDSLIAKYGNITSEIKDERFSWDNIFAETEISMYLTDRIWLVYTDTHDYSSEEPYTDSPTVTPAPVPTATPTKNTQGI